MAETRQFITVKEAKTPLFAGIDLGGTNIKVGVVDDLGRPLSWLSIPTRSRRARKRLPGGWAMPSIARSARPGSTAPPLPASASVRPAEWTSRKGTLTTVINLTGWDNFPIRDRVSHHCGLPVTFENDANAAAYGEFWVGSGRDFESMVLLTLGTGIGCGIIIGDMVVQGAHSHGGEAATSSSTPAKTPAYAAAAGADISRPTPAPWPSSNAPARRSMPAGQVPFRNAWPPAQSSRRNSWPRKPKRETNYHWKSSSTRPDIWA